LQLFSICEDVHGAITARSHNRQPGFQPLEQFRARTPVRIVFTRRNDSQPWPHLRQKLGIAEFLLP
jgi:hypothetical protein